MLEELKRKLQERPDLAVIADLIPENMRILDLGCGDGTLLKILKEEKGVRGLGVEKTQEKIIASVATGVPVVHDDLNQRLESFSEQSFNYVVLSRTLQAIQRPDLILPEILRIGEKAIVSFINFGHYQVRLQLLFNGRMPKTETLPMAWYNTPNIHLATLSDFRELCKMKNIKIEKEIPLGHRSNFLAKLHPNLFAPTSVFVLSKD